MIVITLPSLLLILCMPPANHSYGTSSSFPPHPPTQETGQRDKVTTLGIASLKSYPEFFHIGHLPWSTVLFCYFFSQTGGKRERKEEGRLCRDIFSDMHKFPDQHVTSPDSDTTEPFVKIMRITEMIANARSSDCSTISPCQYQGKFIAKSMENMDTDVWVLRVNDQVSLHRHFSLAWYNALLFTF